MIPKTALQYIESHDHERFICNFGLTILTKPAIRFSPRRSWPLVHGPAVSHRHAHVQRSTDAVARRGIRRKLFSSRVWRGRVALLRGLRWDFFYDAPGQGLVKLVRKLLRIRRNRPQLRGGAYYFFNDWDRHLYKRSPVIRPLQRLRVTSCCDQRRRCRSVSPILVSNRRQLPRRAPRRRS